MLIKLGVLFLLVGILAGSTQYADAILSASYIVNNDEDASGNVFKMDALRTITDVTIGENTYAIVADHMGDRVLIVDYTDPYYPIFVGIIDSDTLDSDGNKFGTLDGVFDVTIITIGERIFVIVSSWGDNGIHIIDITDPYHPLSISSIIDGDVDIKGKPFALHGAQDASIITVGEKVYTLITGNDHHTLGAHGYSTIQIIDITDPYNPLSVFTLTPDYIDSNGGTFDTLIAPHAITITTIDDKIYGLVTIESDDHSGLHIVDFTDPYSPLLVSTIFTGDKDINGKPFESDLSETHDPTILTIGETIYAIMPLFVDGYQIIDITDPYHPLSVSSIIDGSIDKNGDTFDYLRGTHEVSIVNINNKIYGISVGIGDDIQIIDFTDPYHPLVVSGIKEDAFDSNGNRFSDLDAPSSLFITTFEDKTFAIVSSYFGRSISAIDISSLDSTLPPHRTVLDGDIEIQHRGNNGLELDLSNSISNGLTVMPNVDVTTNDISIEFTDNTTVSGLLDGIISINVSTRDAGFADNISVIDLVELGNIDVDITFDQPVRLTLFNQAGNDPFYINAANETHLITTECDSDNYDYMVTQLNIEPECFIDVGDDLVIWTTHFTAYGSSSLKPVVDDIVYTKTSGGSANKHLTRPTFGLSHDTQNQLVDDAFTFNNNTFNITDNWHTPFGIQNVTLGESNSFSAKVYAQNDLMVQEFVFGIPNVGDVHKAELGIEVWYDFTGGITETKVIQKTNVIEVSTLNATGSKVKCQESDSSDNCFMTNISMVFLEPLYHDIMAIKAIDFENRYQTTYLNDGFDISGDSLNPMLEIDIAGTKKYEGPILVTQTAKYSNIWIAEDGREFERNDSGSFKHINPSHVRHADPGEPKTRLHSQFFTLQQIEEIKAKYVLAEICRRCQDISYDKIDNIIEIMPSPTHRNSDSELQQMIIYEAIRAEYTLDKMLEMYSNNPFYKEFRK